MYARSLAWLFVLVVLRRGIRRVLLRSCAAPQIEEQLLVIAGGDDRNIMIDNSCRRSRTTEDRMARMMSGTNSRSVEIRRTAFRR